MVDLTVDLTTVAANNESLFAATASVGAIDKLSIAPISSCCDDSSQQEGLLWHLLTNRQ